MKMKHSNHFRQLNKPIAYAWWAVVAIFLLRSLEAFEIHHHGDPLYYTLVAPKLFYDIGWAQMWEHLHHYAQAGYFDLLYFIPFAFVESLVTNQLICQFIHFFVAMGIACWVVAKTIRHPIWGPLAVFCLLTIGKDAGHFHYAKNDAAVATASLLGALYVFLRPASYRSAVVGGFLLGLAPGIKLSGLGASGLLGLYFCYKAWKQPNRWALIGLAVAVAAMTVAPQLAKNFYYTGNPLFPGFSTLMPGNSSPAMVDYYARLNGDRVTAAIFLTNLFDLFTGKYVFLIAPITFVYNLRQGRTAPNFFFLLSLGVFLLYLVGSGTVSHPRYFFACYFFLVVFLFMSLAQYEFAPRTGKILASGVLVLALLDAKLDLTIRNIGDAIRIQTQLTEEQAIKEFIPWGYVWDHVQDVPAPLIISDKFHYNYYSPRGTRMHVISQSPQAYFLKTCSTEADVARLRDYDFAFIHGDRTDPCFQYIIRNGEYRTQFHNIWVGALRVYRLRHPAAESEMTGESRLP